MKKVFRVKSIGFSVKSGLIQVGHHLVRDRWAVELRWYCPLSRPRFFTLYIGQDRPSRFRIRCCALLAPLMMVCHWLLVLPVLGAAFVVVVGGLSLTLCLGWLFSGLGEWLQKIGRLGEL